MEKLPTHSEASKTNSQYFRGQTSCEHIERCVFNGLQIQLHKNWPNKREISCVLSPSLYIKSVMTYIILKLEGDYVILKLEECLQKVRPQPLEYSLGSPWPRTVQPSCSFVQMPERKTRDFRQFSEYSVHGAWIRLRVLPQSSVWCPAVVTELSRHRELSSGRKGRRS